MVARTDPDPRQAVRRLVADALLATANAAVRSSAEPDDVSAALLATFINLSLDLVPARQVARELRRMAAEVEQLPSSMDRRSQRPATDA